MQQRNPFSQANLVVLAKVRKCLSDLTPNVGVTIEEKHNAKMNYEYVNTTDAEPAEVADALRADILEAICKLEIG